MCEHSGQSSSCRGVIARAITALLGLVLIASASSAQTTNDTCWPPGDLVFRPGSPDDVARGASDFLIKAENVPAHPYWPQGSSGITIGVGWDLGYHSAAELRVTWEALDSGDLSRLAGAAGKKGRAAQALLPGLRMIDIPRDIAIGILVRSLKDYYIPFVNRLFPGLDQLPAAVQIVFISVVFNRGAAMGHDPDWATATEVDRRWDMREMQKDVADANVFGIYAHLGTMKRLWEAPGQRGLLLRRRDEQVLIRPYVDQQLKWEDRRDKLKAAGLPPCPK